MTEITTPEPGPKRCEASRPTNHTVVPCVLVAGHDGDHFSTTGCAGSGIHWAPEPEWRARLFHDLTANADAWGCLNRVDARDIAVSYIEPLQSRITELEADVRALGGDPDRMVDPARRGECDHCAGDHFTRDHTLAAACPCVPAPEVREVPAGEAREGDTVARQGKVGHVYPGGFTVDWGPGVWENLAVGDPGLTVSRPVSPTITESGWAGLSQGEFVAWPAPDEPSDLR